METSAILKCENCGLYFEKEGYYRHTINCHTSIHDVKEIINKYVNNFYSIKDLQKEYHTSKSFIIKVLGDNIRNKHEGNVVGHRRYPGSYIASDETKEKIRTARLKYMKDHPEQTAWRTKNMSYPEKLFKYTLEINGFNKKYLIEREHPIFPYFIDFAFINEKLAIEIDGSQHLLEERAESDIKKDILLNANGWVVYRVTAKQIMFSINEVIIEIENILKNITVTEKQVRCGIVDYVSKVKTDKINKNNERKLNNGRTKKQVENSIHQRKVERPDYNNLCHDIKNLGYSATGRKYGVSDNAIRKWKKSYENNLCEVV